MKPLSKTYLAMLDIKNVVRRWQDVDISDDQAIYEIRKISQAADKTIEVER